MEVYIYADVTLALSILVCVPLLWSVARIYRLRFGILKSIFVSTLCGISTVAVIALKMNYVLMLLVAVAVFLLMVLAAFGKQPLKVITGAASMLAGEMILIGGICSLLNTALSNGKGYYVSLFCVFISTALFTVAFRIRKSAGITQAEYVRIEIPLENGTFCAQALVDTGNMLKEPISLLPVIIVSDKWAKNKINTISPDSNGTRIVPVTTVNGKSILICKKIKGVRVLEKEQWYDAGDVYVGICENLSCEALIGSKLSAH